MLRFAGDLLGTIFAPGLTLRHVARRRSLAEAVAALLLLAAVLVALSIQDTGRAPAPQFWEHLVRLWLHAAAVVLAAWLFFAHLLWRIAWLLGGRGRLRTVACTTALAFGAGGVLAALVAEGPDWARLPILLWCWWLTVVAVRRPLHLSRAKAVAATLIASALAWAVYAAALPWRFERLGLAALLAMWQVNVPSEHCLWPHVTILAALVLMSAAMVTVSRVRRLVVLLPALSVGAVAASALVVTGWFVRFLDGFLQSPLNQPQDVAVTDDGGLLVKGVGGIARLTPDGALVWQHPEPADALLPGPDGSAFLLRGSEGEVVILDADGRVARTLTVPSRAPFEWACRLGLVAGNRSDRLFFLAGEPARLYRMTIEADHLRDEVLWTEERAIDALGTLGMCLSLACGKEATLYLASRLPDGTWMYAKTAEQDVIVIAIGAGEQTASGDERRRLAAGLDGTLYCAASEVADGRPSKWRVWRLPEGASDTLFTKTSQDRDCPGTVSPRFAVDAQGNFYVADLARFRLLVFDPQGRHLRTLPRDSWYRRLAIRLIRLERPGA